MATTSLVMGICSLLLPLLSIPGFILGLVSFRRLRRSPWPTSTGRSVGGIVTSLILGPLTVIMVGIPMFLGAEAARHEPTNASPLHRSTKVPASLGSALAVPTSCGVPASVGAAGSAGPTATEGADHFANLVARNEAFMAQVGVPVNQFSKSFDVTTETPKQAVSGVVWPLAAPAKSLTAYAEAFDGPNSHAVVVTEIEQFPSQKAATFYDRSVFSYDCLMGQSMFSVPGLPAAFGSRLGSTNGTHYLEVSMVIADYRVGLDDYSPYQTPAQASNWAETVAKVAMIDYPGM
ncbi:MAG: DUF4190 domain-containing protein [Acidimicrobiales bacterium]